MYVPATSAHAAPASSVPIELRTGGAISPGLNALVGPVPGLPATDKPALLTVRHDDLNVLVDHASTVVGRLVPALAGQTVGLQTLTAHGRWRTLARTRTGPNGRFRIRYTPAHTGSELMRLRFAGDALAKPTSRRLGRLNVYRLAEASWYGGGGGLACGGELTSTTIGVANKTLPCGTVLTLRYGSRSLRVRVIDRGPYVEGREFDLTEATKRALGFGDVGEVWAT